MSATDEAQRPGAEPDLPGAPAGEDTAPSERCLSCDAAMRSDQEWCLECGAARTLIHRPPDWRIGLALIGTVVLLALVGLAIALINLSGNANRDAAALSAGPPAQARSAPAPRSASSTSSTASTSSASSTAARSSTHAGASPSPASYVPGASLASWPVGLSGWTVVLAAPRRQALATAIAQRLAAQGLQVGVLDSSRHPTLRPGRWLVFAGRYPARAAAVAAATQLRAQGQQSARARQIAPPGGL